MILRLLVVFLTLICLSACSNSEQKARTLLNEALLDWKNGDYVTAFATFDLLSKDYVATAAATDAITLREDLVKSYKEEFDPAISRRNNRGKVGKKIVRALSDYHKREGAYPDTLEPILIGNDVIANYVQHCTYEAPLPAHGYKLNCNDAEKGLAEALEAKEREMHSAASTISTIPQNTLPPKPASYPVAEETWGDHLNPSGNVPDEGFYAFYINRNTPESKVYKETVGSIDIQYAWDELNGIKSEDFGGYWVGDLSFDQESSKHFAISQGHAKTRLIIDDQVIYEGGGKKEMEYTFSPGTHRLEVEHINNWHTTGFSLRISDPVRYLSAMELQRQVKEAAGDKAEVWFVGVYESKNRDMSLPITLEPCDDPIILVLSSYSPVRWVISNPMGADIRTIVYRSYEPGAMVTGDIPPGAMLLTTKEKIGKSTPYSFDRKCSCHGSHFHCERDEFLPTAMAIEELTGAKLTGVSGKYGPAALIVPEVVVDDAFYRELEKQRQEIQKLEEACRRKKDIDTDTIFSSKK